MRLERGDLSIEAADGRWSVTIARVPKARASLALTDAELHWLIVIAGPAVLHERHPHREMLDRNLGR